MKIMSETITSRNNNLVKWAASLCDKKGRESSRCFIAEGEKLSYVQEFSEICRFSARIGPQDAALCIGWIASAMLTDALQEAVLCVVDRHARASPLCKASRYSRPFFSQYRSLYSFTLSGLFLRHSRWYFRLASRFASSA